MSLSARDRKLLFVLVPLAVILGYWMFILSPQRAELSKLDGQLTSVETQRDDAQGKVGELQQSKTQYASDYATVVRLGKAIPVGLDMPSLLVQLDSAAKGTGIDFDSITAGARIAAATNGSTADGAGAPAAPVAAGGENAQSSAGKPVEQANGASKTSDDANKAAGADQPSGGAAATGGGVAGLDTVPLNFTFNGGYFELADFLHRIKRFVRVANDDLAVKGRLMTVDGVTLKTTDFPKVTAEITANVYLAPKTQGATGGATAQGPTATPASTQTPTPAPTSPPNSASPAATPGSGTVR